jgi:hypothetical protein
MSQHDRNFVEVTISTTSGLFPASGSDRVPVNQKVRVQLEKAARELHVADTAGWIAAVGNPPRAINPDQSYEENHLSGTVEINWGPEHGGGG